MHTTIFSLIEQTGELGYGVACSALFVAGRAKGRINDSRGVARLSLDTQPRPGEVRRIGVGTDLSVQCGPVGSPNPDTGFVR